MRLVLACLALSALAVSSAAGAAGLRHPWRLGPEEVRGADLRTLAEALAARAGEKTGGLAKPAGPGTAAPDDDAEIVMMVPSGLLPSMRERGFLNQHQTLTSGGFHRLSERFEAEQQLAMARLPYDLRARALLPKYALLVRHGPASGWRLPSRYGDAAVVFKPEVRRRATWTYADTLDFDAQAGLLSLGAGNPVLARAFGSRPPAGAPSSCRNYCEVQIWGPLDWSDVDRVELASATTPSASLASAVRNFQDQSRRARLTDAELIAALRVSTAPAPAGGFSQASLLAWELALRPKTKEIAEALTAAFSSADPQVRAAALYGLAELPWARLKPALLAGLSEPGEAVLLQALALAAEHPDDADVRRALGALQKRLDAPPPAHHVPDEARLREWLARARGR